MEGKKIRFEPFTDSEKMQWESYRSMTPGQRLEQAFRLREMAWTLKKAGLRSQHPNWTEAELENKVSRIFLHANT